MNRNQAIGLIISILGIVLTILAIYAAKTLRGLEGFLQGFHSFFIDHPINKFLKIEINKQTLAYDHLITGAFWTGLILFLVGLIIFLLRKN